MKKFTKILAILLIFTMVFPLVSCKKKKSEDEENPWNAYEYENLGDFLELADYKSFSISQAFIDREISLILASLYGDKGLYVDVTSGRAAKEWDNVKIEFLNIVVGGETIYPKPENPQDDEYNTQSENSYSFTLGTHEAMVDFENAVIGMTLSSEKEVTITFPDDYTNVKEYAGKTATFKFKLVNHKEPPELIDDLCYRYTTYINSEIMKSMFEQEIIYAEFWKHMQANSALKARPEKEFNDYYNAFLNVFKDYAKSNNKTLEEYVVTEGQNFPSMGLYAGITMDEFYRIASEYADESLKNDLILHSLVRAEGLQTTGPLYHAAQKELLLSYGVGYTIESLIKQHGREQIITSIMDIQVRKRVLTYVTKTA